MRLLLSAQPHFVRSLPPSGQPRIKCRLAYCQLRTPSARQNTRRYQILTSAALFHPILASSHDDPTPSDRFGMPSCAAFAPPPTFFPHAVISFESSQARSVIARVNDNLRDRAARR
jgi:hypothetical protein